MTTRTPRWQHPQPSHGRSSNDTHVAVGIFYAYEAELLDHWDISSWLDLVSEDFVYRVPVPLLTDDYNQDGYDTQSLLMDEDRSSIEENWAARMTDEHNAVSWADSPPVRLLRLVSSVRVRHTDHEGEFLARSNVRILMVRQSGAAKEMFGERFDILRSNDEGFTIASRFVVLTSTIIDAPRLRMLL
jgi:3-phenylpropionate/cinnamic acid dioxygenase small subunit